MKETFNMKKKAKTTIFTMTERIYHPQVVVSFGSTFEEFIAYIKKGWAILDTAEGEIREGWSGHQGFVCEIKTRGGGKLFTIWFDAKDFGTGLLAHEVFHLVCAILRDRGVSLDNSSEEAFAHYLGFWSREIWSEFQKRLKLK